MKYDIYGMGNALVDMEIEVSDNDLLEMNIDKGVMTLVDAPRLIEILTHFSDHIKHRACGGSAANSIIGATQLGAKCFYSCRISGDDTGHFFSQDLRANHVDSNVISAEGDGATGTCAVMITPDAERTMNTFLGVSSELSFNDVNQDALKNSDYFYIEGYLITSPTATDAVLKAKDIAKAAGSKIVLTFSDPSMVTYFKDGLQRFIGDGIDLLFCNEEEACTFTDSTNISEASDKLKAFTKRFAITRGKKGAQLFDGDKTIDVAPFLVQAIDTNGAGDCFAGAFLSALAQGKSFEDAGKLASFASSRVVSEFGPRLSKNAIAEVRQFKEQLQLA